MIKKLLAIKFVRFSISGGIATLVDMGLLYVLVEKFQVWYLAAAVPSFLVGSFVHFLICNLWVFAGETGEKLGKRYLKFTSIHIFSMLINLAVLYALVEYGGFYYLGAKLAAVLAGVVINFLLNKKFTFKNI